MLCLSRALRSLPNMHPTDFYCTISTTSYRMSIKRLPSDASDCPNSGDAMPREGCARVCTPQRCSRPACPGTTCPQRMQPCCTAPFRLRRPPARSAPRQQDSHSLRPHPAQVPQTQSLDALSQQKSDKPDNPGEAAPPQPAPNLTASILMRRLMT